MIEAGGRRLCPALVLASPIAAGGVDVVTPRVIDAAVAVELVRLASLYHDDVLDRGTLRQGRESANAVWGNQAAVLAGDGLLSRAFCVAAEPRRHELRRFCRTVSDLCSGQVAETRMQLDAGRGIAEYEASARGAAGELLLAGRLHGGCAQRWCERSSEMAASSGSPAR